MQKIGENKTEEGKGDMETWSDKGERDREREEREREKERERVTWLRNVFLRRWRAMSFR